MGELSCGRRAVHADQHGCVVVPTPVSPWLPDDTLFPISIAVSTRPSRMHARDDVAEPESRFDATSRCGASKVRPIAGLSRRKMLMCARPCTGMFKSLGDNSFV